MEEVERRVLAAWSRMKKDPAYRPSWFRSVMPQPPGSPESSVNDIADASHSLVLSWAEAREEDVEEEEGDGVSPEQLWEWLFLAPSPHACLSFLDSPDHHHSNDDDCGRDSLRHQRLEECCVSDDVTDDAYFDYGCEQARRWSECQHAECALKRDLFSCIAPTEDSLYNEGIRVQSTEALERMLRRTRFLRKVTISERTPVGTTHSALTCLRNLMRPWIKLNSKGALQLPLLQVLQSDKSHLVRESLRFLRYFWHYNREILRLVQTLPRNHPDARVRKAGIKAGVKLFSWNNERFFATFLAVTQEDQSESVRAAAFSAICSTHSLYPSSATSLLMPPTLVGMEDADIHVAVAATRLLHKVLEDVWLARIALIVAFQPRMVQCLVRNMSIRAYKEPPSLLTLSMNSVAHQLPKLHIGCQLPADLLERIHVHSREKKLQEELIKVTTQCMAQFSRWPAPWHVDFLAFIRSYLAADKPLPLRESALRALLTWKGAMLALSERVYLKNCLFDKEVRIRVYAYEVVSTMVFCTWETPPDEQNSDDEEKQDVNEDLKQWINLLVARLAVEQHPKAKTVLLSKLAKCIDEGYLTGPPSHFVQMLSNSVSEFDPRYGMDYTAAVMDFLGDCNYYMCRQGSTVCLDTVLGIIEIALGVRTSADEAYRATLNCLAVTARVLKGGEPRAEAQIAIARMCKLVKQEIYWLRPLLRECSWSLLNAMPHVKSKLKNRMPPISQMRKCWEHLVTGVADLMSPTLLHGLPSCEIFDIAIFTIKMCNSSHDSALAYAAALLLRALYACSPEEFRSFLTSSVPDAGSRLIVGFAFDTRSIVNDYKSLLTLVDIAGNIALIAPELVEPQWITELTLRSYDIPSWARRPNLRGEDVKHMHCSILKMARHFAPHVAELLTNQLVRHKEDGWAPMSEREAAELVIAMTNLVRLHSDSEHGQGEGEARETAMFLVEQLKATYPRLLSVVNDSDAGELKEAMDWVLKNAASPGQ